MSQKLSAYEWWMVRSNLQTIHAGQMSLETNLATLRVNGYPSIASEVEKAHPFTALVDGKVVARPDLTAEQRQQLAEQSA